MSELEIKTLTRISKAFDKANAEQKQYIAGFADGMALMAEKKEREENATDTN